MRRSHSPVQPDAYDTFDELAAALSANDSTAGLSVRTLVASRRCRIVTVSANPVSNVASSIAESPPPPRSCAHRIRRRSVSWSVVLCSQVDVLNPAASRECQRRGLSSPSRRWQLHASATPTGPVSSLRPDQAVVVREYDGLHPVPRPDLGEDSPNVLLHRRLGEGEAPGDLGVSWRPARSPGEAPGGLRTPQRDAQGAGRERGARVNSGKLRLHVKKPADVDSDVLRTLIDRAFAD